jgi:hypothetical protein
MLNDSSFMRWGGLAAIGAGIASLLYGLASVLIFISPRVDTTIALMSPGVQIGNLLLALGSLLSMAAIVAIFQRVRGVSENWARLALWLGMFGALSGLQHGWSDFVRNPILARALGPTSSSAIAASLIDSLPSPVDARGVGTFGLTGLALLIVGLLLLQTEGIPQRLAQVALAASALLGVLFLGTVLYANGLGIPQARFLIFVAGPLYAIVAGPAFFIWFGTLLRRTS